MVLLTITPGDIDSVSALASTTPGTTLVGPYTDLFEYRVFAPGTPHIDANNLYMSSGFAGSTDRSHGATWGSTYPAEKSKIRQAIASTKPTVLLVQLGTNDLALLSSTDPTLVLMNMRDFVREARRASRELNG